MKPRRVLLAATAITFANTCVNVFGGFPKPKKRSDAADLAKVSVLIPARDEERVIGRCLDAAVRQCESRLEVLVLNDHSTDATQDIVNSRQDTDSRIRSISAGPLEPGWTGKTNACRQLAEQARGDWLVFIDADVELLPGAIAAIVGYAERHQLDFLSGTPRLESENQRVTMAFAALVPLCLGMSPLWLNNIRGGRFGGMAMGMFVLFRTSAYNELGGHARVREELLEDVHLGWAARRAGLRTGFINLSEFVRCDMHPDLRQSVGGLTRWFQNLAKISASGLTAICAFAGIWALAPWCTGARWIAYHFGILERRPTAESAAIAVMGLSIGVATLTAMNQPAKRVVFQPPSTLVWLLAMAKGVARHLVGRPDRWRGRSYPPRDTALAVASVRSGDAPRHEHMFLASRRGQSMPTSVQRDIVASTVR